MIALATYVAQEQHVWTRLAITYADVHLEEQVCASIFQHHYIIGMTVMINQVKLMINLSGGKHCKKYS